MLKVQLAVFLAKNSKRIIPLIACGVILLLIVPFIVISALLMGVGSVFSMGGDDVELRPLYTTVGTESGVYWPDLVVYDAMRTDSLFTGVTIGSIRNTADAFTYEVEICMPVFDDEGLAVMDENDEPLQECHLETRYYTLEEVLIQSGYDSDTINYALELSQYSYIMVSGGDDLDIDPDLFQGQFAWPTPRLMRISSMFGDRVDPISGGRQMHYGIDIAGPQAHGQDVVAVKDGRVYQVRYDEQGCGTWIRIQHEEGFESRYCHLHQALIEEGTLVVKGDVIGLVGNTGNSTGAHLHFELKKEGQLLNPLPFIMSGARP